MCKVTDRFINLSQAIFVYSTVHILVNYLKSVNSWKPDVQSAHLHVSSH